MNKEEEKKIDTRFKPGKLWTGNAKGRPKGSKSLKGYVQDMLRDMVEEEKLEFLMGIDKKTLWEMAEGKPKQDVETEVKGDIKIGISEKIANKYGINDTTQDTE